MQQGLSRAQIAVYAALGVVLLLLGAKALRGADAPASDPGGITLASEPVAGGGGRDGADLVVHVAGAVSEPGVYRLAPGSRVADALERAGGASRGGAPDGINLAARLADGQQVVVPRRDGGGSAAGGEEGPVSLGTAEADDLEELDGIGPVTAGKIVEFRDSNGGVGSVEELDAIPGIGPATVESLSRQLQP